MPRSPRNEFEPGIWHVWARGNNRERIYRDEVDCLRYLARLGGAVEKARWKCLSYCLMVNHVHLVIETVEPNLGWGMGRLHGHYAQMHNRRHGRSGRLFGDRFGGKRITSDEQLWWTSRYVAQNPVAAGICGDPAQWRWGSYAAILSESVPAWLDVHTLAGYFGGLRRYLELASDLG